MSNTLRDQQSTIMILLITLTTVHIVCLALLDLQLQGDGLKLVCLGSFLEEVVLVVEGVDEILETPQLKTQSLQIKREG